MQDLRSEFRILKNSGFSRLSSNQDAPLGDDALSWWDMATERLGLLDERFFRLDEQVKTQTRAFANAQKIAEEMGLFDERLRRLDEQVKAQAIASQSTQRRAEDFSRDTGNFESQHTLLSNRVSDLEGKLSSLQRDTAR